MGRFHKTSFLFLFLHGLLYNASGEHEGRAKKILNEMGNLPGIIGQAFKLYETFRNIYEIHTTDEGPDTDDRLDAFNEKLEQLNSDLRSFEDRLDKKLDHTNQENKLETRLKELSIKMNKIDDHFNKFVNYANESLEYFDSDLPELVDTILRTDPIDSDLNNMHQVFGDTPGTSSNVPMLLRIPSIAKDYMCTLRQTPQQFISILYERMLLTEVKAYAMLMYAYEYKRSINNKTTTSHDLQNLNLFKRRMNGTYNLMKSHMPRISREVWKCDESQRQIEDTHYARVGPVLQKFVMLEASAVNVSTNVHVGCTGDCEDLNHVKMTDDSVGSFKHCNGYVRNCETHYGGPNMEYCLAKDGYRRYTYIKYGTEVLGEEKGCANGMFKDFTFLDYRLVYNCYYCLCTCESNTDWLTRYFSLRPVKSDYENNKVIVSARLQLKYYTLYIQIRQGKLLPAGRVEPDKEWTPIEVHNYAIPKENYKVTWDNRKVLLDDLYISSNTSEENRVMTGLRFEQVGDQLRLGVFLSKFNYSTGKLGDTIYHVNDLRADHRSPISLDKLDVPNKHMNNVQLSGKDEYLEFTTSDLKKDAGQNVLPFVDIQQVESYPFSPLSGAGLFLRVDDRKETGGYLALKLFTLDTAPYLTQPKLGEKPPVSHE